MALSISFAFLVAASPWGPTVASAPPFSGTSSFAWSSSGFIGCASSSLLAWSSWNSSSGRGVLGGDSHAMTTCGPNASRTTFDSEGNFTGGWWVEVPVHLPANTSTVYVNATWALNWSGTDAYQVGHWCHGSLIPNQTYGTLDCAVSAAVSFQFQNYLIDTTTNAFYGTSNPLYPSVYNDSFAYRDTTCHPRCTQFNYATGSGGSTHRSTHFTFRFSVSNPATRDRWVVLAYLSASAWASVVTSSSNFGSVTPLFASAHARLDLGQGKDGATLQHLTVA